MIVMAFGVFDFLHLGHLYYLSQAKKMGSFLVVVIARDINVKRIKGRFPKQNERERLLSVKKTGIADKVILGQLENRYKVIEENKPDIIALGYDQKANLGKLKKFKIKIVRLKSYKPHIYKSSNLIQLGR